MQKGDILGPLTLGFFPAVSRDSYPPFEFCEKERTSTIKVFGEFQPSLDNFFEATDIIALQEMSQPDVNDLSTAAALPPSCQRLPEMYTHLNPTRQYITPNLTCKLFKSLLAFPEPFEPNGKILRGGAKWATRPPCRNTPAKWRMGVALAKCLDERRHRHFAHRAGDITALLCLIE